MKNKYKIPLLLMIIILFTSIALLRNGLNLLGFRIITSFLFYPLIIWGIYGIYTALSTDKNTLRVSTWALAFGMAGLISTNLFAFFITLIVLVIFAIICIRKTLNKFRFSALVSSVIKTFALSSFFTIPFLYCWFSQHTLIQVPPYEIIGDACPAFIWKLGIIVSVITFFYFLFSMNQNRIIYFVCYRNIKRNNSSDIIVKRNYKTEPLVSVIIPVYNGAKFLNRSINCIFNQTHKNIELITINDGSKDNSLDLLNTLKENSPSNINMRIVNQENCGICKTRNTGLELATGEYIMFMDQDDDIKHDCIESLLSTMFSDRDYDIAICGYDLKQPSGKIIGTWQLNPEFDYSPYRITSPWGRLYKSEIIKKYNIKFMDIKISEDFYFNLVYLSYCKKIGITPYVGYSWYLYPTSESHANMSIISKDRDPIVMLTKLHEDMHIPNNLDPLCLEFMMARHIFWYLLYIAKSANKKQLREAYISCLTWLKNTYPNYTKNPYIKLFGKHLEGEAFKINFIVRVSTILDRTNTLFLFLRIYSGL